MKRQNTTNVLLISLLLILVSSLSTNAFSKTTSEISFDNHFESKLDSIVTIDGFVHKTDGSPMSNVEIFTSDGTTEHIFFITKEKGEFSFEIDMEDVSNLRLRKEDNYLEGVNTFDILLILRHVLQLKAFEVPSQYIAGDIDINGIINANDIIQLRKLILGADKSFQLSKSWKFYPSMKNFANPEDILLQDYSINSPILSHEIDNDITASKIGDMTTQFINNNNNDTIRPTPYLMNGSSVHFVAPNCNAEIWGIYFEINSSDNSTTRDNLRYTFSPLPPQFDPLYNPNVRSSSIIVKMSDFSFLKKYLRVFVWDQNNNYSFSTVKLILRIDGDCN